MIFLDVGAHEGQTLAEVMKPEYGFEWVYAFEPMPAQFGVLAARWVGTPRLTIYNYGLAGFTGNRTLYGANDSMEASLFPGKTDVDETVETTCSFMQASECLRAFEHGIELVVKLNCEGAEIQILDDLIDTGMIGKVAEVLIDFDIRKVPGLEAEADRVIDRLEEIEFFRYSLADKVMVGDTHQERIAAWLKGVL